MLDDVAHLAAVPPSDRYEDRCRGERPDCPVVRRRHLRHDLLLGVGRPSAHGHVSHDVVRLVFRSGPEHRRPGSPGAGPDPGAEFLACFNEDPRYVLIDCRTGESVALADGELIEG